MTVKNLYLIASLAVAATGCSTAKHGASSRQSVAGTRPAHKKSSPQFLDNVSTGGSDHYSASRASTGQYAALSDAGSSSNTAFSTNLEESGPLQFKYAILLDIPVEDVINRRLFSYIEGWYGAPYKYGGTDRNGVDCSAFVQAFMSAMYDISVPRTSIEQYRQSRRISKKNLREGDLVFFKTSRGRAVSHVGVYLENNKFLHASTSSGVMISDLDESYFRTRYVGAGRF